MNLTVRWWLFACSLNCVTSLFRDLPLLYEKIGRFLNILQSNGCCWIKCQFCISICFKLGTVGRYCVTKGNVYVPLRFKLHPRLRIFEQLHVKKWNTYENFWSFAFAIKINQEVRKCDKDSLILIARSRQRFALSVTTGVFVTASAWTDGTAVISISSRASLDMNALFATSSSKLKRRISSSWVKGLEHIEEFRVGFLRSPLFYEINPLLSPDIS